MATDQAEANFVVAPRARVKFGELSRGAVFGEHPIERPGLGGIGDLHLRRARRVRAAPWLEGGQQNTFGALDRRRIVGAQRFGAHRASSLARPRRRVEEICPSAALERAALHVAGQRQCGAARLQSSFLNFSGVIPSSSGLSELPKVSVMRPGSTCAPETGTPAWAAARSTAVRFMRQRRGAGAALSWPSDQSGATRRCTIVGTVMTSSFACRVRASALAGR